MDVVDQILEEVSNHLEEEDKAILEDHKMVTVVREIRMLLCLLGIFHIQQIKMKLQTCLLLKE
jgi:hypothetical protein